MNHRLVVGVGATKAPWSGDLRSYLRDHTHGVTVHVVMDRPHLELLADSLDVLIVDDVMRLFNADDMDRLARAGAAVIGVREPMYGQGAEYLRALGAMTVFDAGSAVSELASLIDQCRPRYKSAALGSSPANWDIDPPDRTVADGRHATLTVWTKASGGAGLTETVIAAAEHLSKQWRVLLIELEDVAPVMASRLLRTPDNGLEWALLRAAHGRDVVPDALSGPRGDGYGPLGRFDAICSGAGQGHGVGWVQMQKLLGQVERHYDHIFVESPGVQDLVERDRSAAGRGVLGRADSVVVLTGSDPESAGRLVEWRAASMTVPVLSPCWAVFGRFSGNRSRRGQLADLVGANTAGAPFRGFAFLPEDAGVQRARWGADLVRRGPWLKAVRSFTEEAVR